MILFIELTFDSSLLDTDHPLDETIENITSFRQGDLSRVTVRRILENLLINAATLLK